MKKTLCLNMIVKNESHVIKRCLDSVKPIIDYWVIFDTGSTDGTQEIIKECLKEIPGELHESPWVNFEHNRNEALRAARTKADYLFFFDADERLVLSEPFDKSTWDKDFYMIKAKGGTTDFFHPNIVSNDSGWHWTGVLHECIMHHRKMDGEILSGVFVDRHQDGARSRDPKKLYKDAEILEAALKKEPWNSRHVFYLAQTYASAKEFPLALKYYEKRAAMDGDKDETFWTVFRLACLQEAMGMDSQVFIPNYCKAHQMNQYRGEPLERMANYYIQQKCFSLSYLISKHGKTMRMPTALNSDFYPWIYEYGMLLQFADSAFFLGYFEEAIEAYSELLSRPNTPADVKAHSTKHITKARNQPKSKEPWEKTTTPSKNSPPPPNRSNKPQFKF
ncbi:MAG: glycosyltransferase family 2 protein [Verrucomicrobia bacterium]|nr:glycosyltransferase family 2 protein [Verrucomicrobiota bacterium]